MDANHIFWTSLITIAISTFFVHAIEVKSVCKWRFNIPINIKQQSRKISELEDRVQKQQEEIDSLNEEITSIMSRENDILSEMMKLKNLVETATVGMTTPPSSVSVPVVKENAALEEMKESIGKVVNTANELSEAVDDIKQSQKDMAEKLDSIHIQDVFDCSQLSFYTGVLEIKANNNTVNVYCNKGWMSIARRIDGSVNFYRNWVAYTHGFGDPSGEHFIGLDNLAAVTKHGRYKLRIELTSWSNETHPGETRYAEYDRFSVSDETDNYRLRVGGYSGTAGDSLSYRDNVEFTTYDKDNDLHRKMNCAEAMRGAWWHKWCAMSSLFGPYVQGGKCPSLSGECIIWYHWPEKLGDPDNHYYSFKAVDMKIYPLYSPDTHIIAEKVDEITKQQKFIKLHLADIDGQLTTHQDCSDLTNFVGRLSIKTKTDKRQFRVYCNQGWLSIARRMDGSVDFYRTWSEYQTGFGNVAGEYFLGLENLVSLLKDRRYKLRVELTTWGVEETRFAEYTTFRVSDLSSNYSLTLSGYSGNAGDSLGVHNGTQFSTFDRDNEDIDKRNCAMTWNSGWWFIKHNKTSPMCGYTNPFGLYVNGGLCGTQSVCLTWNKWPELLAVMEDYPEHVQWTLSPPTLDLRNSVYSFKKLDIKIFPI